MSAVRGELATEEEVEDLADDYRSLDSSCVSDSEKVYSLSPSLRGKSGSPYLNSLNLHVKRTSGESWRTVTGAALQNSKTSPAHQARDVWLHLHSDGHETLLKSPKEVDYGSISRTRTPEYLKEALGMKKPKHSRSASNGYVPGTPDYKEKEEMYEEIIDLKKTIQSQKAESDKMKTKLRRLEEENTKKDRQIEQLLDPPKDPDYARGLVDGKSDPRSIINGLKQKILRLEQQCKEKESALRALECWGHAALPPRRAGVLPRFPLHTSWSKKIIGHFLQGLLWYPPGIILEVIVKVQRLRVLLESVERSNKAENKQSRRQIKTLSATVLKLTKTVQELEDENQELKKELSQEEMSMMDSSASRARGYMSWSKQRLVRRVLDLEKRLEMTKDLQIINASDSQKSQEDKGTESANQSYSINTNTKPTMMTESDLDLKKPLKQLGEEKKELRETLTQREQEMSALVKEINSLKEKLEEERKQIPCQAPGSSSTLTLKEPSCEVPLAEKNRAAEKIQKIWRSHKRQDLVVLQSCLRGHLSRRRQLDGQKHAEKRSGLVAMSHLGVNTPGLQEEEVTLLQSVFRAHLKRIVQRNDGVSTVSSTPQRQQQPLCTPPQNMFLDRVQNSDVQTLQQEASSENPGSIDSDDSDVIIVSPSRPMRRREQLRPLSADDLAF
ncbi:hypothetical protein DNTS_031932 [Danionella cerebrum]|uniref:IQ domain-containing protein E n=1 Tax=Danionella cerebrum TaxID=2873325 RepID=A0A553Q756_9TELE|nr:hypothetical protein DNTS_031932 [Danionella translucida]